MLYRLQVQVSIMQIGCKKDKIDTKTLLNSFYFYLCPKYYKIAGQANFLKRKVQ
jgi:hypothetical protein